MNCKYCNIKLDENNSTKNGIRNGKQRYKKICKPCHIDVVKNFNSANPKRNEYVRKYIRQIGRVKLYHCESCSSLCYKKYAKAFCSDICRFISYIEIKDECWIWIGALNRNGYGKLSFRGNKTDTAHRVSYKLFNGDIEDKFVCHSCDIPTCVNPDHLWLGTHKENMMDMVEKDRQYSKLKPTEVFKIRKLWDAGYTQQKIMELFEVTNSQISSIVARRIWKHV